MVGSDYELQFIAPRARAATWRSVHLNVYTGKPEKDDLDRLAEAQHRMREVLGGNARVGVFGLAEGGLELPDAEVRRYGSKLQSEMSPNLYGSATVLSGGGFWVSAAISVVNTMMLVARPPTPARVFSDIEQACGWLADLGGEDPSEMLAAMNRLRAEPESDESTAD